MNYIIREMHRDEYPYLKDFLYEAIFIPKDTDPPPKSIVDCPELQVYVENFGSSSNDKALVAIVNGQIIGAIWARIMNDYGHIDDNTPSIAMSLYREYRGLGIGTTLLKQLLSLLKSSGYSKVSLSVQKANYALKMYQNAGFKIYKDNEEEYIMIINI